MLGADGHGGVPTLTAPCRLETRVALPGEAG